MSYQKPVYNYQGYPIFLSDRPEKKYYALTTSRAGNPIRVYFGATGYEQFRDKIGYYSDFDHHDPIRRRNYKLRHEGNRHVKGSAGWFSDRILW